MKDSWSVRQMPDLTGKQAIITGANSGLGYQSARALARAGARVTLACRSRESAAEACQRLLDEIPSAKLEPGEVDLGSLDSVRHFVEGWRSRHQQLDILLNNAGVMTTPLYRTEDGFEGQIGTNHFGHFALTGLLWPVIAGTAASRIVNVSSLAHKGARLHFDNLNFEDESAYTPIRAYKASKLANLLFTFELVRRIEKAGVNCVACAAHPGASMTNLARHLEKRWYFRLAQPAIGMLLPSPEKAALPQIRAATDPDVSPGDYFGPSGKSEWRGDPVLVRATRAARDPETALRLWQVSEQLTEVHFLS